MDDRSKAASLVMAWSRMPLDPHEFLPIVDLLREQALGVADPVLRGQVDRLVELSSATVEQPGERPEEVTGDDLVTALNLQARMIWQGHDASATGRDDTVAALADRLDDLVAGSAQLRDLGLDVAMASDVAAHLVRFASTGVSTERAMLIRRLFDLPPERVRTNSYVRALTPFALAAAEAGRADLWQQIAEEFLDRIGDRAPSDALVMIARHTQPLIERDSRWYRAEQTWDQATQMITLAETGQHPLPAGSGDRVRIALGLAFLDNRDLDERPFLDVVSDVYDKVHGQLQPSGRPELLARSALRLVNSWVPAGEAAEMLRGWINRAYLERADLDEEESDAYTAEIDFAWRMELVLTLRAGEPVVDRLLAHGTDEEVFKRLEIVVIEGRDPQLADELDRIGATRPGPTGTGFLVAGAAVRARFDPDGGQERFGELGGLGSGSAAEPDDLQRLRFAVSQALLPPDEPGPDGERVDGVPPQLYSDDPAQRLWVMESQFGGTAFMSAIGSLEEFREHLPVLIELYTRGIGDIDEQVLEASVIFARRIIYGFQRHELRAEALQWARRVAQDLRNATTPRAVRARVLALHDVVREADRPEAQAAADEMWGLLEDNDADYAIVERALLKHTTLDWEEDPQRLIIATEQLVPLLIDAIEHDEYEQQDYPLLIRSQGLWLFHRYCDAQDWPNVARTARIFLDWPGGAEERELDGIGAVVLRTEHSLDEMDQQTALRMREAIDEARGRLADLGPTYLGLVEARGDLNRARDVRDEDLQHAVDAYEEALPRYLEAARAHIEVVPEAREKSLWPAAGHASELFLACWRADNDADELPPATKWLRTARSMRLYLRLGTPEFDPNPADDLKGMVRLAGHEDTFAPLADQDLVAELYRLLEPHLDRARDVDWIDRFHRVAGRYLAGGTGGAGSSSGGSAAAAWDGARGDSASASELARVRAAVSAAADQWEAHPAAANAALADALAALRRAYDADPDDASAETLIGWGRWWLREAMQRDAATPRKPYNLSAFAAMHYLRLGIHVLDPGGDEQVRELIEWAVHPNGFVRAHEQTRRELYDLLAPLVDPARDDAKGFARNRKPKLFGLF